MEIDVVHEVDEMESGIKAARDYLSCEKILINNIRRHVSSGMDYTALQEYTASLAAYYAARIKAAQSTTVCVNYRYAVAFLNALHEAPHLSGWIQASKL